MNKQLFFFLFLLLLFITACTTGKVTEKKVITIAKEADKNQEPGSTFQVKEGTDICTQDGKPIIREFATTWCPHCGWIKETYTKVVQEYAEKDYIVARLWNIDTGDDALSKEKEVVVPQTEKDKHLQFNPQQSIPTFVFGCKYYRIGNAFEQQNNLAAEEAEFRAIIEKLLEEVKA